MLFRIVDHIVDHTVLRLEALISARTLQYYHIVACGLILVLSSIGSLYLGKDLNWDLRNYHYYNPAALLTNRIGFDFFPGQRQNWLNPLIDIPTYIMITHLAPWMVGALMGVWHGINLICVYAIAHRVFYFVSPVVRTILATAITVFAITGSLVRGLWGTFTGDFTVSVFVLAALALFLSALITPAGKAHSRTILLSGLIIGFGTGLRMTVAVHAIPLVILALFLGSTTATRVRSFFMYGVSCAVGFAVSYGWWGLFLQSRYGSPFFPYYNAIFRSPFVAPENLVDLRWMPASFVDHLVLPLRYFVTVAQGDVLFKEWRPGIVYIALLVLCISLVWRYLWRFKFPAWQHSKPMIVLLLFTVVSWIIWQVQFSYYRYLAPLELLFPAIMLSIAYLVIPRLRFLVIVYALVFIVVMRRTDPASYERGQWGDSYFNVAIPAELRLEDAQVIIVDEDRPLGYFVPFFPASTQVLRLTSNLDPGVREGVTSILRDQRDGAIAEPSTKFVMYDERVDEAVITEIDRVLLRYGLQRQQEECATITSSFYNVAVCSLRRINSVE
jgi:hypothetical protein